MDAVMGKIVAGNVAGNCLQWFLCNEIFYWGQYCIGRILKRLGALLEQIGYSMTVIGITHEQHELDRYYEAADLERLRQCAELRILGSNLQIFSSTR